MKYTCTAAGIILIYGCSYALPKLGIWRERPTLFARFIAGYIAMILANLAVIINYYKGNLVVLVTPHKRRKCCKRRNLGWTTITPPQTRPTNVTT